MAVSRVPMASDIRECHTDDTQAATKPKLVHAYARDDINSAGKQKVNSS